MSLTTNYVLKRAISQHRQWIIYWRLSLRSIVITCVFITAITIHIALVILYISSQKRVYGEVVYMWQKNESMYKRVAMYGGTLIICAAISMLIMYYMDVTWETVVIRSLTMTVLGISIIISSFILQKKPENKNMTTPAQPHQEALTGNVRVNFCPNCGTSTAPNAIFCTHCGKQI